jgi:hypothetical protein
MSVHGRIQDAWIRLDSNELEAPAQADSTLDEPEDIEARAHELALATPVHKALLLCSSLGFSIYALLGLDDEGFSATLGPAQHVAMIRTTAQLTPTELDKKIGRDAGFIESVEAGNSDLLACPVELALNIAQATQSSPYRLLKVLEHASKRS